MDKESTNVNPNGDDVARAVPTAPDLIEPHERLAKVLDQFIREIDSLASTFPLTSETIRTATEKAATEFVNFLTEYGTIEKPAESVEGEGRRSISFEIDSKQEGKYEGLKRNLDRVAVAADLVPRSLFVALISQYDSYLGKLIKTLLLVRPEVLNGSDKTLKFSDIIEFESIGAVRDYIIEREIGAILRESHTEHFEWMEAKFDLKLRKELPVWSEFIEITERRNLFVHTGGVVSAQYLKVCDGSGAAALKVGKGEQLPVDPAYFERAYEIILEIGVKLAHVLWRKLMPNRLKEADQNLLGITFNLIVEGKYALAIVLLDFATNILKKHSSADYRMRFVINRAQAHKWSGNEMRCLEILDAEDFSAVKGVFRLAEAVLRDDFATALEMVREIGSSGEIGVNEYREWPVFKEFRKNEELATTILDIFKVPLLEFSLDRVTQEIASSVENQPDADSVLQPKIDHDHDESVAS